jgi:hypothetical protein
MQARRWRRPVLPAGPLLGRALRTHLLVLHEGALDADLLAELVEDDGDLVAVLLGEDELDQRRLARAQETCAAAAARREMAHDCEQQGAALAGSIHL